MLAMILGSDFDVTEYVLQTRLIFVRRAICHCLLPNYKSDSRTAHLNKVKKFRKLQSYCFSISSRAVSRAVSLAESVSGQDAVSDYNNEERKVVIHHRHHHKVGRIHVKMTDGSVCKTEFLSHS
ncbi:hypothetical protein CEXT_598831 [Caerostris extrusa]|uniref:Uncharacterized protein n=1 Tax=Caerostris extrusa TaxID=172846 RepID=A0AAV4QLC5_CAEEX|nr:hypothetical protein CEXT_598831 [Caerostris extrusa]